MISVGELLAPVVGGLLYHRAGILAITAVSMGLLGIDLVMRLLVIDAKMIPKNNDAQVNDCSSENGNLSAVDSPREPQPGEGDPLLRKPSNEEYKIRKNPTPMEHAVPILYCFRNRRFLTAMILVSIQSVLIGAFDATVPEETKSVFHFSSLQVGLVFIAIVVPNLVLGPVAGMAVDKYGTKVVATAGYLFLVPCLLLLGLPSQRILAGTENVVLFCAVLALNGAGMSIIASPGLVEATHITEKYEAANPDFFGENGPYAQLYGFSSLFAFAGLAVGPLVSGLMRDCFGYSAMTILLAVISLVTAMVSFAFIGERRPRPSMS